MPSPRLDLATRDAATCLGFFTRLPVRMAAGQPLAAAIWAAPIAGFVVGAIAAAALLLSHGIGAPPAIAAGIALAAGVLVTGALHEDGLADVADGFGGGTTRERKLDIMRDSRIGSYGVVALVLTFGLRWSALTAVLGQSGPAAAVAALLAAHMAGRALLPIAMFAVPHARSDGLSVRAGRPERRSAALALLIGAVPLLALGPGRALVAIGLLAAWMSVLLGLARSQIGGQTGDVLGTLEQGGEVAVLCAASLA